MKQVVPEQKSGPTIVVATHDGVVTIAVGGEAVDIDQRRSQPVVDAVDNLIDDTPALGRIHRHRAGEVS